MNTLSALSESAEKLLEASRSLTDSERLALALAIWDTISLPADWKPSPEVLAEVRQRRNELQCSPKSALSAEEMKKRLDAMKVS